MAKHRNFFVDGVMPVDTDHHTFCFDSQPVRTIKHDGTVWFVAADICAALEIANPRHAVSRLDDDEKRVVNSDTPGGHQGIGVVNECGLYGLILTSRKKEAKRFKRWITHDVLPSIRETGRYQQANAANRLLGEPAYREKAQRVAVDYLEACRSAVKAAGVSAPAWPAMNEAVVDGLLADILMGTSFHLSFDQAMQIQLAQVPKGAMIVSPKDRRNLAALLQEHIPSDLLPEVMRMGLDRLAGMAAQKPVRSSATAR